MGDRLGLGSAFRQGFAAVVDLLLLMTGFMALAPWLGTHLAPVITPVFSAVGCDPSLFASLFLAAMQAAPCWPHKSHRNRLPGCTTV